MDQTQENRIRAAELAVSIMNSGGNIPDVMGSTFSLCALLEEFLTVGAKVMTRNMMARTKLLEREKAKHPPGDNILNIVKK